MRYPTTLLTFVLVAIFNGGCSAKALTDGDLQGRWKLVKIGSRDVVIDENRRPRFTISGDNISGFDGCNRFSGHLNKPGSVVSTRMACLDTAFKLPLAFDDLLTHLQTGTLQKNLLTLPAWKDLPASEYEKE